jgi:hypothetical protein
MEEDLNNRSQHKTTQDKTNKNNYPPYVACTPPVRLLCGCTVLCACWWLRGANEGGSIKWCCDKTRQKEQGATAQNPNFTSHLNITLYPRPPPTPFPSTTHSPAYQSPPTHARQGENKRQMKQNLNLKIRDTSEHALSTTHYLIQNFSLQPEIYFCHLFHFYPIPSREFFLYRKKKCFFVP